MSDINKALSALKTRILRGAGASTHAVRRAAFDNSGIAEPLNGLINKVARHAYKVTDEDFAAVKASGLNEEEIFEIVVCAAIGQATRQYDSALQALAAATSGRD